MNGRKMIQRLVIVLGMLAACLVPLGLSAQPASALSCGPYSEFSTISPEINTPNSGVLRVRRISYFRTCTTSAFDKVVQVRRHTLEMDWFEGGCGVITRWTLDVDRLGGVDPSNVSRSCVDNNTASATFWWAGDGVNIWVNSSDEDRCVQAGAWAYGVLGAPVWSDPVLPQTHCFNG